MNYEIRRERQVPAYIQLYDYFRRDIVSGAYSYGTRLPSKRTIAEETGVSVITVQRAVELLCEEGYVETKERSGYYVIFRKTDFPGLRPAASNESAEGVPEAGSPGTAGGFRTAADSISASGEFMTSGNSTADSGRGMQENDTTVQVFPFSVLARTMRKVLQDEAQDIMKRCPGFGLEPLRGAICSYLARSSGISVDMDQVVIGAGAEYLYGLIAQLFERENTFALECPSYEKIRRVYEAFGKECEMLELSEDGIRTDELKKSRARILHITPFHSYPSGVSASISKKHEYLAWAHGRDGYIIEDNYDSELTVSRKAEETLYSMETRGRVIYLNTFSQTISPSLRIGYMVLPYNMVEIYRRKLGFYSCTVPVFEQYMLAELLETGEYERHINRERRRRRTAHMLVNNDKLTDNFLSKTNN